jgi:hypothetical protein
MGETLIGFFAKDETVIFCKGNWKSGNPKGKNGGDVLTDGTMLGGTDGLQSAM